MTIRITVKNEDVGEKRIVSVAQLTSEGEDIPGIPAKTLSGGESTENYVHSTNQIVVKEVRCE